MIATALAVQLGWGEVADVAQFRRGEQAGRPLSPRQQEILALLAQGRTNAQIADALVVSRHTVVAQLKLVYARLQVGSRAEAAVAALRLGLL